MVALAVLAGCAPVSRRPVVLGTETAQRKLMELPHWQMVGRVAVQANTEGWNAHVHWEHDHHQDRIRLSGPFSQGAVSIVLQSDSIYINEGNGVVRSSRDPDSLLRERLGFAVPLSHLRYWMLGLPAPGEVSSVSADYTTGRAFSQQGWHLSFERFNRVNEFDLPQKISVKGGDLKLKLIADEWTLH